VERRLRQLINDLDSPETTVTGSERETDDGLASRAASGDQCAFEKLFERHRFRVGRIAGRFFSKPERVEDVVQDAFVKLYFALGDYRPERGASFAAWLSRIAINSCYDHLRRDRRRPENSLSNISEEEALRLRTRLHGSGVAPDAEAAVISRDLASKLLSRLEPEDRIVLGLLDTEGLSVTEISELTGWSRSKVKVRVHRARASLRKILSEYV
jgi:RNA polymerase sigma-70 factor (ECF subfamily)